MLDHFGFIKEEQEFNKGRLIRKMNLKSIFIR